MCSTKVYLSAAAGAGAWKGKASGEVGRACPQVCVAGGCPDLNLRQRGKWQGAGALDVHAFLGSLWHLQLVLLTASTKLGHGNVFSLCSIRALHLNPCQPSAAQTWDGRGLGEPWGASLASLEERKDRSPLRRPV